MSQPDDLLARVDPHRETISLTASVVTGLARLILGGLMLLAASMKLQDPQSFAFAIKGFKIIPEDTGEPLIVMLALVTPWTELLAGLGLILGLWTRACSLVVGGLLVSFIAGLLSVILRDMAASCSCFGDLNLVCGSDVGWCQVARNVVLLGMTAIVFMLGGGRFSIDGLVALAKENLRVPPLGLGQGADADPDID